MLTCDLTDGEASKIAREAERLGTSPERLIDALLSWNEKFRGQGLAPGIIPEDRPTRPAPKRA
jgi:hypothetical protein